MLYKNIYDTLKIEKTKDISTMTGLTVFHQSLLRDKRLVLAYLYVMISLSLSLSVFDANSHPVHLKQKLENRTNIRTEMGDRTCRTGRY